jgi:putative DNA primase/helicase
MTSQLPFAYDPEATCPTFHKFLTESLVQKHTKEPDGELKMLVLEALGYSLTANTDFRVSFWLVGESGSGKSVLLQIIAALAGNSHTTIDLDELSNSTYQLADIAGKRVVIFTEPRANSVLADNHYKRLVSQDYISARQIFGKPFRFRPICKVWGAMNETPRVVDRSNAVFNRVKIIPFNYVVPEHKKDVRLIEKLEAELPGIFNIVLVGLKRLRRGAAFEFSQQSENEGQLYKAENDIEAAFIADWCIRSNSSEISAQRLYDAYSTWCKRNGAMPKSSIKVARDWQRLGFQREHSRTGTIYRGLMLTEIAVTNV